MFLPQLKKREVRTIGYYSLPRKEYSITYKTVLPKKSHNNLNLIKPLDLTTNLQKMQGQRNLFNNITWKQSAKSKLWETTGKQQIFFNK